MFILTVYNHTAYTHVLPVKHPLASKCDASTETAMRCIKSATTLPSETDVPMNSERQMLFKYW